MLGASCGAAGARSKNDPPPAKKGEQPEESEAAKKAAAIKLADAKEAEDLRKMLGDCEPPCVRRFPVRAAPDCVAGW